MPGLSSISTVSTRAFDGRWLRSGTYADEQTNSALDAHVCDTPVVICAAVRQMPDIGSCLVVEDDPDTAEIIRSLVEILGLDCCAASSGRAALELASTLCPDVVLVDLSLPDMTGYEVARALRLDPRVTYLVALTGFGTPEHRARSFEAGFDEHLVKPIERSELDDAIVRALVAVRPDLPLPSAYRPRRSPSSAR
jgi:CheY-like chemotaxis protein